MSKGQRPLESRYEINAKNPMIRELNYSFELSEADRKRLDDFYDTLLESRDHHAGYPCTQWFDYSELFRFLNFSINNVGDPFHASNFRLNSHTFEREVVGYFSQLFKAAPDTIWGYVNNGGTEGNMYGLYLGREAMENRSICYFSQSTHYSVSKIARVLGLRHVVVRSQENGEFNYDDLFEMLKLNRHAPPLILANIGTTMTGGIDDIPKIQQMLEDLAISQSYIHADAALSGLMLPFIEDSPPFAFDTGVDSISVSGHKAIGSPMPCGVALARREHVDRVAKGVEYVGVLDTTLSGSRNAFTPLVLWYALRRYGSEGLRTITHIALNNAKSMVEKFRAQGVEAWRNDFSNTVVFPRPSNALIEKWQLASQHGISHVLTMPSMTEETVAAIVSEVSEDLRTKRVEEDKEEMALPAHYAPPVRHGRTASYFPTDAVEPPKEPW